MLKPTTITMAEKIQCVESLIVVFRDARNAPGSVEHNTLQALKGIVADMRARQEMAVSVAEVEIARRVAAVRAHGECPELLEQVGREVVMRWPVMRQALQRFGQLAEEER